MRIKGLYKHPCWDTPKPAEGEWPGVQAGGEEHADCQSAGQVGLTDIKGLANLFQIAFRVFTTPLIMAGLAFYSVGSLFWLAVLSRLYLSLAYPMLALTYVLVPMTAWLFLGEQVSGVRGWP